MFLLAIRYVDLALNPDATWLPLDAFQNSQDAVINMDIRSHTEQQRARKWGWSPTRVERLILNMVTGEVYPLIPITVGRGL